MGLDDDQGRAAAMNRDRVIGAAHAPSAIGGIRAHVVAVVLLLLALALIYGRSGGFDYVDYDDMDYVVRTEPVRAGLTADGVLWAFTVFHKSNWHPLTWISHMIDVSLFGLDPGPAHLVNVAFHGANSLLVYLLALVLLRNWGASLLVAYLFLAHPLHVESVAWIAERKDLLCAMFFLLSILAYLRYAARPGARRYALVVCAFALALLSKPMAVMLPVVLLLLDFWPLGRLRGEAAPVLGKRFPAYAVLLAEKIPLFALSLASGIVTLAAQKAAIVPIDRLPLDYRLMNSIVAYATYLRDTIAPTRLAMLHPLGPIDFFTSFLPSLLVLVAISIVVFGWRKRYPWLLFGWLWFLLTLLPVIGLIQVGDQSHADRYMYLPSIGLFLALGAALAQLSGAASKKALLVLAPALVFYSFTAWIQLGYWSGPYMLYTRVLDVVGESFPAHVNLAGFHLREGRVQEAEAHALKALSLNIDSPLAYAMLGDVLATKKSYSDAEELFRMALSKSPRNARLLNNLGIVLEEQGRLEEARQLFAAALKSDPNLYKVRENLKRVGG
jgi:protein O-mannosyl-transferase